MRFYKFTLLKLLLTSLLILAVLHLVLYDSQGKPHTPEGPAVEMVLRPGDLLGGRQQDGEEEDGVDSLAGDRQGRLGEVQGDQDVKTQHFTQSQIRSFISRENQKQVDTDTANCSMRGGYLPVCHGSLIQ